MSNDNKIIAFPSKNEKKVKQNKKKASKDLASVTDIGARRQEIIQEERRSVKRTILSEFIGVHMIVPGQGLQKCSLYDISEKGIAFDLEKKQGQFHSGETVAMRVYLNHKTYFTFVIGVKSVRYIEDEGVYRHGASFVAGTMNEEALMHFVKFIESVSAGLKTDSGDVIVSNLDSSR